MSNPGTPVGQDAYQASFIHGYANAFRAFQQTANRYGGTSAAYNNAINGMIAPPGPIVRRMGRHTRWVPGSGAIASVGMGVAGGTGYVANEVVTMAPLNGGRPVVVRVLTVTAGAPATMLILDQGGGALAGSDGTNRTTSQTAVLTQASTTGVGTGATWTAFLLGFGWGAPQPNPLA